MESYANIDFYTTEYGGPEIPSDSLDRLLPKASWAIDRATQYKIQTLERMPQFTQRQVRLAACAEAAHLYSLEGDRGVLTELGGYSIGDVSVSISTEPKASDSLTEHYQLSDEAVGFLMPTGLLNRRL